MEDGSESSYVAEQVSHHPPISAFFYANPQNRTLVFGEFRPKSKFLGNSAATLMQGPSTIILADHPDERYDISMPNVYARGLLFGTMVLELGDNATVTCDKNDFICEMEFTSKVRIHPSPLLTSRVYRRDSSRELITGSVVV